MGKMIRLDKYLADMSVGTRSEVKVFIRKKRVTVNENIVTKENIKIDVDKDVVALTTPAGLLSI